MNCYNKTKLYSKTKNSTNSRRIIQIALHENFIADMIRCAYFDAFCIAITNSQALYR